VQEWVEHLHADDRPRVLDARRELHEGKVEQISIECRYLHPITGQRWIHHVARVAARNTDGHTLRSYGVVRDITAHKEAENEARQLRDSLTHLARVNTIGVLSGSLAHELNQPLGIILSNAQAAQELLAQDPPDLTEVQDILADIVAADRRAGEVIGRLREMLKRGKVSLRPLLLNEVIEEVLHIANSDLIGRGITAVHDLAADLPPIAGDRVQLQQLVLNLVVNGADAMASTEPGMRRLHFQTKLHHSRVQASVRDEGAGLPADPDRLFQPFYSTKPQGLGLGLSICQAIVDAHDGRLWAEPHPDRGAVFYFELPIAGSLVNP
jgi:C4-dicarboxylate-specific signal transduction histidine kinase